MTTTTKTTRKTTHRYRADLVWTGSTGAGYRSYPRTHQVSAPPATNPLTLTCDLAFGGDADHLNPEQLLLAATSSCQLLSFLALAARAGIDVVHYEDDADASMPDAAHRMSITEITLRPQIVVAPGTDLDVALDLVHRAHEGCYIANTLTARVTLEPAVEYADAARAIQLTAGRSEGAP